MCVHVWKNWRYPLQLQGNFVLFLLAHFIFINDCMQLRLVVWFKVCCNPYTIGTSKWFYSLEHQILPSSIPFLGEASLFVERWLLFATLLHIPQGICAFIDLKSTFTYSYSVYWSSVPLSPQTRFSHSLLSLTQLPWCSVNFITIW